MIITPRLTVTPSDDSDQAVYAPDLVDKALVRGKRPDLHGATLDLDATLSLMGTEISEWLEMHITQLRAELENHLDTGGRAPRTLLHLLQDLRGQMGSMGYPLAGRAAGALHALLDDPRQAPSEVLMAHIDAIKAIVVENARGADHAMAHTLVESLEEFGRLWTTRTFGNNSESTLQA